MDKDNKQEKIKKRILLVEDDPELQNFYRDYLSEMYNLTIAGDGEDGFAKLTSGHFDLVMLDIMLPKMSGLDFLKKKRQNPRITDIPVVVMTNLNQDEVLKKSFELGAKYYILKVEVDPEKIPQVLEEALKTSRN